MEEERLHFPANEDQQASKTVEDKQNAEETTAIAENGKSSQSTFDKIMCHMISCGIIEVGSEETTRASGGLHCSSNDDDIADIVV